MIETNMSETKLQVCVGRTKRMLEGGYTIPEIANALGLNEDTVRAFKNAIDQAEQNRNK